MIKTHPQLNDHLDVINSEAERLGLNSIKDETDYCLRKLGAKRESSEGYPNAYDVITGKVMLLGGKKEGTGEPWVALFFQGRGFSWFKTSPIIGAIKMGTKIEIETQNSFYLLSLK